MDNANVTKKYASATVSALLLFGAVAAGLVAVPQTAYAVVTVTSSADTFYGPGFVRVLITDTAFDESGDSIFPTIEARDGSSTLGSISSGEIEAIGSSGQFEFFITTSTADLGPANPTKVSDSTGGTAFADGPFIIRVDESGANTALTDDGAQTDANGAVVTTYAATNSYGLGVGAGDTADIDNFRILYGGQTLVIDFDDSTSEVTADRTEAGDGNEIVLTITDQDANTDPTLVDIFEFADADVADLLDITNTLDTDDADAALVFEETGQNTGIFEEILTVVDTTGAPADTGVAELEAALPTGESFTVTDHSVYEDVTGTTSGGEFDAAAAESDTDSVSVTLRNRDGAVQLLEDPTLKNGLQVQITDADRNIDTSDGDDITVASGAINVFIDLDGDGVDDGAGEPDADLAFTETDDSTGLFLPDYTQDKIRIIVGAAEAVDGAAGTITLTPAQIEADTDIVFVYTDPAFQTNDEFQLKTETAHTLGALSAEMTTVGITDDVVLTLTDDDLNTDPQTIQTYAVASSATPGDFEIGGETVATLTIEAGDEDDILGVAANTVDATFIETGPDTGVFVADDIDVGDISDQADGDAADDDTNIEDGEEITFTYDDLLDDDDDDIDITVEIPDAGIDVDRSTVPVPTSAAGEEVTIVLSVIDPTSNTNPGSVESVIIDTALMATRDGDGVSTDGSTAAGLTDIEELTGIAADFTLTETGPNTGIFEDDIELDPTIADLDRLIDTRVTFEFDDETVSVTYRAFDGTITVDPAVAGPGGIVNVTVVDSDGNRDPDEEDEIDVTFETDEDTEDAGQSPITLTETGPDTGIFTEEVELGVDIDVSDGDDFSTEITFTYTDAITSAGDEDEDREATVRIATSTGSLLVEPEIVGPGTEITLTLIDTDLNENPNGVDDTAADAVELSSSDGDDADIAFEETGPNTGIFEATIQFEPRDADVDGEATSGGGTDDVTYTALPGDVIAFRYEDEANTGGGSTIVSIVIEITSVDPTMSTAEETVQVGGTIALTVDDADANRDADSLDSVDVDITSDSDPVGFTLAALETGENTGIFTVNVPTSQTVSSGSVTVATGDDVFLEYNDEFPADYADRVETVLDPSKDFVLVVPVGQQASDTTATTPEAPVIKDISGEELDEVTVGQQIILSVDINNNNDFDQDFAGIVEVRDADGFTVYLQWQTGTLPAGGAINMGLSFVPTEAGDYTVRTFVLSSIQSPSALSLIEETTFTVS